MLNALGVELKKDGYKRSAPEIFTKKLDGEWSGWISISGNSFVIIPTIGIINRKVNKVLYYLLQKTRDVSDPPIKPKQFAPPFFVAPLSATLSKRQVSRTKFSWEYSGEKINGQVLSDLILYMRNCAFQFIEKHQDLATAVQSAYTYNKFMQAQQYCIPIALLMLNSASEFDQYVAECTARFAASGTERRYKQYILELVLMRDRDWTECKRKFRTCT